jgi:dihydropyrimidinase
VRLISVTECDLVIRGGTVATSGSSAVCDVGISNGKIVQLGGALHGSRDIDASGALVLPGGIDMHVHLSLPSPPVPGVPNWVDDFSSGSKTAIAGGVTTVGNMTFQWPGESLAEAIRRDLNAARKRAAVDYVLHPVLMEPSEESLAELPTLAADGHVSVKLFMTTPEFESQIDAMISAIKIASQHGMLVLLHCEDGAIVRFVSAGLLARGRGTLADWAASSPDFAERAAVDRAVAICQATASPIYIVHLSSASALDSARSAQARGLPIFVETRPPYLYLTSQALAAPDGGKYVGSPPLRELSDLQAMWLGLADGSIHTVGSDHAPWSLRDKTDSSLDITNARQGVADLETLLPMLFSEGVRTRRITLSRFVELISTTPARLFGLYPRKGTIGIGSDADIVIMDPQQHRVIDGASMHSRAGYSIYDGREVYGWPRFTLSRGDVVLEDGEVTAPDGRGQWLPRSGDTPEPISNGSGTLERST